MQHHSTRTLLWWPTDELRGDVARRRRGKEHEERNNHGKILLLRVAATLIKLTPNSHFGFINCDSRFRESVHASLLSAPHGHACAASKRLSKHVIYNMDTARLLLTTCLARLTKLAKTYPPLTHSAHFHAKRLV